MTDENVPQDNATRQKRFKLTKNDQPGNWSFGISRDHLWPSYTLHFYVWHFSWFAKS